MFRDHPDLGSEYIDVFYGDVFYGPRNELDAEMIERARAAADGLFKH